MIPLIEIVSHPQLVGEILKQFAFMMLMSKPEDNNFPASQFTDLNDLYQKADEFFVEFTSIEELIMTKEVNLTEKITEFLKPYNQIFDVTAIQQNIHYNLSILDEA